MAAILPLLILSCWSVVLYSVLFVICPSASAGTQRKVIMSKLLIVLKLVQKLLPYVIGALTGGAVVATTAGCKCGSLISIVP